MSLTTPRFAIRTIRNGQVIIGGKTFEIDERHMPYDGRLDGLRMAFGRYHRPWKSDPFEDFVCLWGTERAYRAAGQDETVDWPGPDCIDGRFVWQWWHVVPSAEMTETENTP